MILPSDSQTQQRIHWLAYLILRSTYIGCQLLHQGFAWLASLTQASKIDLIRCRLFFYSLSIVYGNMVIRDLSSLNELL